MKKIYKFIFLIAIFSGSAFHALAQNYTLYFMTELPQSIQSNPAMRPACRFFWSLPGDVTENLSQNALSIDKMFVRKNDSLYFNFDHFYSTLPNTLGFRNVANVQLFGLGFNANKIYWSFTSTLKTDFRFDFPKSFFDIKDGNWDMAKMEARTLDFSGLENNFYSYLDNRLAASYEFTQKIHFGVGLHLYSGIFTVNTSKSDLKLNTDNNYNLSYEADYQIETNLPLDIQKDAEGKITGIDVDTTYSNNFSDNPVSEGINTLTQNIGFGIDLGATYQFTDKIQFAAAVNNLGYIKWKDGIAATAHGKFVFSGIDFSEYITNDSASFDSLPSQLMDSVTNSLDYNLSNSPGFRTSITPNVTLSAVYRPTKRLGVGAMLQTQFYGGRPHQSFTLSGNFHARFLNFGLTYSMMNRSYANIGFGMGLKLWFFQWYIVSDTWSSMASPYRMQNISLRTGLNINLGCKEKIDLPMYNEEI